MRCCFRHGSRVRVSRWLGGWGPEKFVDDSLWFAIATDPIGNGNPSSPSNSQSQSGADFPLYTMRDMVNIESRLVTEVLEFSSLHAVIGICMGGLEVFEWLVSYPIFVRKAAPIVGAPRTSGYDLLRWQTEHEVLEASQRCDCLDAGRWWLCGRPWLDIRLRIGIGYLAGQLRRVPGSPWRAAVRRSLPR